MPACIEKFRLPRYREIPDVGLYLDQTVKYVNRYLAPLGCMEITSSMVSNYVKKGYISNPVRKQYDADQIAYLFFITVAKSVLTMENIARLFEMQRATYTSETAYDFFCQELENMLQYTFGLKECLDVVGTPEEKTEAKIMLRSTITAVTHIIYLSSCFDSMEAPLAEEERLTLPEHPEE
ncbi:MAG: DUF1836 domain-containing protein [Clostridia bacterium]|nr:DUF1836 domain-containing protein [Clostridia bacterium]